MTEQGSLGFSEAHLRGISATLGKVAQSLCDFEDYANGRAHRGPLFREINALSAGQKEVLQEEIREIRRLIAEIQAAFPLTPIDQAVHKIIWATCAVLREWVIELESRYMARYGPFDPSAAEFLDPRVKEIEARLRRISGAISRAGMED